MLLLGDEQAYHQVESIRIHPNYDKHYSDFDFALLKLSKEVTLSTKVGTICLPSENFEAMDGSPLIVIGWGTTQSGGKLSSGNWRCTQPFNMGSYPTAATNL